MPVPQTPATHAIARQELTRESSDRLGNWLSMGMHSGFVATGMLTFILLLAYGMAVLVGSSDPQGAATAPLAGLAVGVSASDGRWTPGIQPGRRTFAAPGETCCSIWATGRSLVSSMPVSGSWPRAMR